MKIRPLGVSQAEIAVLETLGKKAKKSIKNLSQLNELPNLDVEKIQQLETLISYALPQQYREFLLQHNGGYPENQGFQDGRVLNYFYGYFPNILNEFSLQTYLFTNRYPQGTMPIASVGGGDRLLLGLTGDLFGKIYYWQHDWESDDEDIANALKPNNYFENVTFIANSFNEFLAMLYE